MTWWLIPTIVTLACAMYFAMYSRKGEWAGIENALMMIPLLIVALLAWAIAGVFK